MLKKENSVQKVALVTGSSRGIGRAVALELAGSGYDVCINYVNCHEAAAAVCRQIEELGRRCLCVRADIGSMSDQARLFAEFDKAFDRLDLLVNNAGITKYLPFLECTEALWNEVTNTDWKGSFFATQHAAKRMIDHKIPGVVINITSIHQTCNFPVANVYGPTKAALNKFTQHAALELAPYGIRVVAIAPGCTKIYDGEDETPRGQQLVSRIPLKRYGTCSEIAKAVSWLASADAAYITGTCLMVDGGSLLPVLLDNKYVPGV